MLLINKLIKNVKFNYIENSNQLSYNCFLYFYSEFFIALCVAAGLTIYQKQTSFYPYMFGLLILHVIIGLLLYLNIISYKKYNYFIIIFELFLTVMSPFIYMTSGGLYSCTFLWFFFLIIFTSAITEGIPRMLFFSLQLVSISTVVILDYKKIIIPEGVLSRREWYVSIVVVTVTLSILLCYFISNLIKEYENSIHHKNLILNNLEYQKEKTEDAIASYIQQKEIAEKAVQTQKDFLSNMSHEIRTPLNAIIGLSETIHKISLNQPTEESIVEIRELSDSVVNTSKILLQIINNILDYQSINENKLTIKEKPYSTEAFMNLFNSSFINIIKEKGLNYDIKAEGLPKFLKGDIVRIQQVIANLLSNAIKYTEEGMIIYSIKYDKLKRCLTIEVSDTGQGIKEEEKKLLFDKFSRLNTEKNKNNQGSGLGLSIVRQILDLMNGVIHVESTYGEGSTFTVIIPQEEATDFKIEDNEKSKTYDFKNIKALYIDDTQVNHLVLDKLLQDTNMKIKHILNPRSVIDMGDEILDFNVFFIDYLMPDMNGIELNEYIRTKSNAPSFMITADVSKETQDKMIGSGFNGYISKPINKNELCEMIEKIEI